MCTIFYKWKFYNDKASVSSLLWISFLAFIFLLTQAVSAPADTQSKDFQLPKIYCDTGSQLWPPGADALTPSKGTVLKVTKTRDIEGEHLYTEYRFTDPDGRMIRVVKKLPDGSTLSVRTAHGKGYVETTIQKNGNVIRKIVEPNGRKTIESFANGNLISRTITGRPNENDRLEKTYINGEQNIRMEVNPDGIITNFDISKQGRDLFLQAKDAKNLGTEGTCLYVDYKVTDKRFEAHDLITNTVVTNDETDRDVHITDLKSIGMCCDCFDMKPLHFYWDKTIVYIHGLGRSLDLAVRDALVRAAAFVKVHIISASIDHDAQKLEIKKGFKKESATRLNARIRTETSRLAICKYFLDKIIQGPGTSSTGEVPQGYIYVVLKISAGRAYPCQMPANAEAAPVVVPKPASPVQPTVAQPPPHKRIADWLTINGKVFDENGKEAPDAIAVMVATYFNKNQAANSMVRFGGSGQWIMRTNQNGEYQFDHVPRPDPGLNHDIATFHVYGFVNGNEMGSNQANYLKSYKTPPINVWTRKEPMGNGVTWQIMPAFEGDRITSADPRKTVYSYLFPATMVDKPFQQPESIIISSIMELPDMKITGYRLSRPLPPHHLIRGVLTSVPQFSMGMGPLFLIDIGGSQVAASRSEMGNMTPEATDLMKDDFQPLKLPE